MTQEMKQEDKFFGLKKVKVTFENGYELTAGICNEGYVKIERHIETSEASRLTYIGLEVNARLEGDPKFKNVK